jgi:1-acyl-sn-glycerol-3-phosphate acyltransferase
MKRETLQSIFVALLTRLARVEFCGTQHLPKEGGLLVTTNHMSRMDTLYLFLNPGRNDITALVADKYKKYPIFNWVLDTAGIIWLERGKADFGAFRMAADVLKSGVALGIAPEGTRSQIGQLQEGKPGTVLLAQKAGVPIVPVGIAGTEMYFKRLRSLRRPQVRLTFGPAYSLPPIDRANRDESLKQLTDEIMCRIAILLPPQYWGFYKDHPRLIEMLANKPQYI